MPGEETTPSQSLDGHFTHGFRLVDRSCCMVLSFGTHAAGADQAVV